MHPSSYAPNDGVPRHPIQFYELLGHVAIPGILLNCEDGCRKADYFSCTSSCSVSFDSSCSSCGVTCRASLSV